MSAKGLAFLSLTVAALCGQDPEWTGERRIVENRFYISPWPADAEAAARIAREQVVEFILHLGIPSVTDGERDVYQFRFASLSSGKMHLVAVIAGGGTIGANTILIAHCEGAKCVEDTAHSDPPIDLDSLLVSVRHDGTRQLLEVEPLVGLDGRLRAVRAYELFELGPEGLERATEKYRDGYIKAVRPLLEAQRGKTAVKRVHEREVTDHRLIAEEREAREFRLAAADYALALFNDRMGLTTNSLVEHALKWSRSDIRDVQALAVWAVRDSSNSNARQQVIEELKKSDKLAHLRDELDSIEVAK